MTNDSEIQGLASLKRPELQRMCKKWGLKASGKNSELMERLEEALRSGHAAPANEESGDTDENELNERIETLDSQGQGQSLVQVESERAEEQREANGPFAEISGKIETLTINDSVGNETVVAQIATAAETDVFERTRPLLSNSRRSSVSSKATNASNSTKSSSLPRSKLRRPTYLKHIHSRVDSGLKKSPTSTPEPQQSPAKPTPIASTSKNNSKDTASSIPRPRFNLLESLNRPVTWAMKKGPVRPLSSSSLVL